MSWKIRNKATVECLMTKQQLPWKHFSLTSHQNHQSLYKLEVRNMPCSYTIIIYFISTQANYQRGLKRYCRKYHASYANVSDEAIYICKLVVSRLSSLMKIKLVRCSLLFIVCKKNLYMCFDSQCKYLLGAQ